MADSNTIVHRLQDALNSIIVGQPAVIRQLLVALLSGGHVILEGVPGTGKTLLVKVLARFIQAEFKRVQLTPDILPADILGAMEEQQVTLDGETLPLPDLFWVIATQNPLEFEGTYPLPEAQLDRFFFKLVMDYPETGAAKQMLLNFQQGFQAQRTDLERLQPLATVGQILEVRQALRGIKVDEKLLDYLLALVAQTRQHPDLILGASPRSAIAWLQTSKAQAWFSGRDYVIPDDIKAVATPLLRHRLILKPEAQLDGVQIDAAIASILKQVAVPR